MLTLIDERAQSVRAAPGVTPEGGSVEGAPVLKLIEHSVLGKPLVGSLHMRMPVMELFAACDSGDSLSMGATRTFALCCVRPREL